MDNMTVKSVFSRYGNAAKKDHIIVDLFTKHTVVVSGKRVNALTQSLISDNTLRGESVIEIPAYTAAFVYTVYGIEDLLADEGNFEYNLRAMDSKNLVRRVGYLRMDEIPDFLFGTHGPMKVLNNSYYAYGHLSIKIVDPMKFFEHFVPTTFETFSLDDPSVRAPLTSEFLQVFQMILEAMFPKIAYSELNQYKEVLMSCLEQTGINQRWLETYGLRIMDVTVEHIDPENAETPVTARESIEWQIEQVRKLKELLDEGAINQQEFDIKKKEIMNL